MFLTPIAVAVVLLEGAYGAATLGGTLPPLIVAAAAADGLFLLTKSAAFALLLVGLGAYWWYVGPLF